MVRQGWKSCVVTCVFALWTMPQAAGAQSNYNPSAADLAAAMDIPASAVTSATLAESPGMEARGVLTRFGSVLVPQAGVNLAALSSGTARDRWMPGWADPAGKTWGTGPFTLPIPHPDIPGCPSAGAPRDLTELRIELVVPAGVAGFRFDHNFLAHDYPEWVCTTFSDAFLAVVESPTVGTMNVALDAMNNPITLNSAFWVAGAAGGGFAPSMGTAPLVDTGYESGGATMWNTASVPAAPGETVVLRIFIYDAGDSAGDSTVLLDNFQWLLPGTAPPVVNAGADQTVTTLGGSANVTLSGTASDPEGGAVSYAWSWAGGSASGPAPTVTLPVGVHVLTLTATDPDGGAGTDTVTIAVLDGTPSLADTLAALGTSVAAHDTSIAALQSTIATLQSTIEALQSAIAALEASLTAQGTRLEGAESRAAALEAQVLTLQTALQGLLDHPIWNSVPNAGGRR